MGTLTGVGGNILAGPFTVTVGNPVTPVLSVTSPSAFTVGTQGSQSVTVSSSSGTVSDVVVSPTKWNDLELTASGTTITISGTPKIADNQTFTVTGKVNGAPAQSITFSVTAAPASAPALKAEPVSIQGTAGTDLSESVTITQTGGSGAVSLTSVTPTDWNGLTFAVSGTSTAITVTGEPLTAGISQSFSVSGTVGGIQATPAEFTVTIASATVPALSVNGVNGIIGASMNETATVTSTTSGTVEVTGITGDGDREDATTRTWNGLTVALQSDGRTIRASGTPTGSGTGRFTVAGTVDGVTASSTTFTVTVGSTYGLSLSGSSATFTRGSAASHNVTAGSSPSGGTVSITSLNYSGSTNLSFVWNNLTVTGSGSTVSISGTPTAVGSASFTVSGRVNGAVSANSPSFTIYVTEPSASYLSNPSQWTQRRNGNRWNIYIPVTKAFVDLFASGGRNYVIDSDLDSVFAGLAASSSNYAELLSTLFSMHNGSGWGDYGTLQMTLNFDPESGHDLDWYRNMILDYLEVNGDDGEYFKQLFNSIDLASLSTRDGGGSSGGCDAGIHLAGLALLLAIPMFLRKKD